MSSRPAPLAILVALLVTASASSAVAVALEGSWSPPLLGKEEDMHGHGGRPGVAPEVAMTLGDARWAIGASQLHLLPWGDDAQGSGVRVAVIDTGIDPDHPDLVGRVVAWRDFVAGHDEPYDDDGHGTHVAAAIAAHGHLQTHPDVHYFPTGARGTAPGAELLVAKALTAEGTGSTQNVAAAVHWALDPDGDPDTDDGAAVINLSLGTTADTAHPTATGPTASVARLGSGRAALEDALRHAVEQGTIVVVAAGNQPHGPAAPVAFPASMPEVITVGATDGAGKVAAFSRSGADGATKPDLVAPGVLLSAAPRETSSGPAAYRALGGTSMAAGLVSGAVALLLKTDPLLATPGAEEEDGAWRTERVRELLTTSARPIPDAEGRAGHGVLRVDAALRLARPVSDLLLDGSFETLIVGGLLVAGCGRTRPAWVPYRAGRRSIWH